MERVAYKDGESPWEKQVTRRINDCLLALSDRLAKKYAEDRAAMRKDIDARIAAAIGDFGERIDRLVADIEATQLKHKREIAKQLSDSATNVRARVDALVQRQLDDFKVESAKPARRKSNDEARQ